MGEMRADGDFASLGEAVFILLHQRASASNFIYIEKGSPFHGDPFFQISRSSKTQVIIAYLYNF